MKSVAIFYSSGSGDTKIVADWISKEFNGIKEFDIEITNSEYIEDYCNIIFGISTYSEGSMQEHWEKIWDNFSKIDFKGKKVAIFGLGDQINYPNNFVDAMGTIYKHLIESKAEVIGFTSNTDYNFNSSKALIDNKFVGLVLDLKNQEELSKQRINNWVKELKANFN